MLASFPGIGANPPQPPMKTVQIIDSHTGGEPTRLIIGGGPELGSGPLAERRRRLSCEFDAFRRAVVCEPRGSVCLGLGACFLRAARLSFFLSVRSLVLFVFIDEGSHSVEFTVSTMADSRSRRVAPAFRPAF